MKDSCHNDVSTSLDLCLPLCSIKMSVIIANITYSVLRILKWDYEVCVCSYVCMNVGGFAGSVGILIKFTAAGGMKALGSAHMFVSGLRWSATPLPTPSQSGNV